MKKRYHKIRYIRYISTRIKNIIKQKKMKVKNQTIQIQKLYYKVQNNRQLFDKLSQRKPLKIMNVPLPSFFIPKKANTIIQQPTQQVIQIPYLLKNQSTMKYAQIDMQQFLNYKGQLHLSIAQMPLQRQNVILPQFIQEYFRLIKCGKNKSTIESINLWHYKGSRTSTWHYDGHDNFLIMTQGRKQILLMPPNIINFSQYKEKGYVKSYTVFDVNHNHLNKQFESLWNKKVKLMKCQIEKGQCIFMPRGWWHYVVSHGQPNIGINVWGNSIKSQYTIQQQEILLKHLILQSSQRFYNQLYKQKPQYESILDNSIRKNLFINYFNKYLL